MKREDILSGLIVARQSEFGEVSWSIAADESKIDEAYPHQKKGTLRSVLWAEISLGSTIHHVMDELTLEDVPPPRDEADYEHVLVIGEFKAPLFADVGDLIRSKDYPEVAIYSEEDRRTDFIGKELSQIG